MSRLIARFVVEEPGQLTLLTRYADRMEREALDPVEPVAVSIQPRHPAANWFERKAQDDFGVRFDGSPDNRPLVHHEHIAPDQHPMRRSFNAEALATLETPHPYPYEVVEGDTTYEIAVGPIHAGIIEPGHFHFSQAGEHILHQEVRHFYKYRAIEKMLEGKSLTAAWPIVSRISGHSSIAWQLALAEIAAQAGAAVSDGQRRGWALLLELERLAHHLTDLGFIPNDAGFGAALAWATALAEDTRRLLKTLTGHRFGFDVLLKDWTPDHTAIRGYVRRLQDELTRFEDWIVTIPSLWDRLDTTGKLRHGQAELYDVVGVVARASGVSLDVRAEQPLYQTFDFRPVTEKRGDVAARFKVRLREAKVSLQLIDHLLDGAEGRALTLPETPADGDFEARVESVLGELYLWLRLTDGRIERFYARDPSFVNWQALPLMMPGNIIADFPLINKSCDLSYAGNDL